MTVTLTEVEALVGQRDWATFDEFLTAAERFADEWNARLHEWDDPEREHPLEGFWPRPFPGGWVDITDELTLFSVDPTIQVCAWAYPTATSGIYAVVALELVLEPFCQPIDYGAGMGCRVALAELVRPGRWLELDD